jgi:hypothetical protein
VNISVTIGWYDIIIFVIEGKENCICFRDTKDEEKGHGHSGEKINCYNIIDCMYFNGIGTSQMPVKV